MTDAPHRPAAVEMHGVGFSYGSDARPALDGVSLTLAPGELTAIVGPSGAGKSTLLHLVAGLQRPTVGTITVDGHDLAQLHDDELADFRRTRVGLVFQFFNLFPTMTAWENVAVPAVLGGSRLSDQRPRAMALLEEMGLAAVADRSPASLSGGEQQRIAIARALLLDPPLVLADEPTGNLDSAGGATVLQLLARAAATGRVVLMATHDRDAAAAASRVLTLRDGRLEVMPWA